MQHMSASGLVLLSDDSPRAIRFVESSSWCATIAGWPAAGPWADVLLLTPGAGSIGFVFWFLFMFVPYNASLLLSAALRRVATPRRNTLGRWGKLVSSYNPKWTRAKSCCQVGRWEYQFSSYEYYETVGNIESPHTSTFSRDREQCYSETPLPLDGQRAALIKGSLHFP